MRHGTAGPRPRATTLASTSAATTSAQLQEDGGTLLCLGSNTAGSAYEAACSTTQRQRRVVGSDGTVKNVASGRCLDGTTSETAAVKTVRCGTQQVKWEQVEYTNAWYLNENYVLRAVGTSRVLELSNGRMVLHSSKVTAWQGTHWKKNA